MDDLLDELMNSPPENHQSEDDENKSNQNGDYGKSREGQNNGNDTMTEDET